MNVPSHLREERFGGKEGAQYSSRKKLEKNASRKWIDVNVNLRARVYRQGCSAGSVRMDEQLPGQVMSGGEPGRRVTSSSAVRPTTSRRSAAGTVGPARDPPPSPLDATIPLIITMARTVKDPARRSEPSRRDRTSDRKRGTGVELSVVMPCLNEADTLEACILAAQQALAANGIAGEIIVADNGSEDGSREVASRLGARVVGVAKRGYGSALMGGIAAAHGRYILMGDADESYDFAEIPRFLAKLREGYDLVQGCRLPNGGGVVERGAMPFLHRWLGNPLFSYFARSWFKAPINDVHCGMRAFTKSLYHRLDQQCTGMEFASENIIKASLLRARIAEVPITLHPDGRVAHPPHLKTFRDGWRHLRFYLMFSPRWLFLLPGTLLIALGVAGFCIAMPGLRIRGVTFDVHTLLFASLAIIAGYQSILFALMTKIFAIGAGLLPSDRRLERMFDFLDLERGVLLGVTVTTVGLFLLGMAVNQWRLVEFGPLDYSRTMRLVIPGTALATLGFQTVLSSFFFSILGLRRK